jgi:hypothetical protein
MNLNSLDSWNSSPVLCKHPSTGFIPNVGQRGDPRPAGRRQIEAETLLKNAPHTAEMAAATAKAGP